MTLPEKYAGFGRGKLPGPPGSVNRSIVSRAVVTACMLLALAACVVTFRTVPAGGVHEVREYLGTPSRSPAAEEEVDRAPQVVWRYAAGRGSRGVPAVGDRVTVVTTLDRWVYAVDTRTGELFWRYRGRGRYGTGPLMSSGAVFAASEGESGELASIDLRTGRRRWRLTIGGVAAPMVLADDVVYGVTEAGAAFAVDARDGSRIWTVPAGRSHSGPMVVGSHVLIATITDTLLVLDAGTGTIRTRGPLPTTTTAPLALADDSTAVMASPAGLVLGLAIPSGEVRWSISTVEPVFGAPVVARDTVFALGNGGLLWAIPVSRPQDADSVRIQGVSVAAPTILRRGVLVATVDGSLIHFDRAMGRRIWVRQVDGELRHPAVVRNGQIVVAPMVGEMVSWR